MATSLTRVAGKASGGVSVAAKVRDEKAMQGRNVIGRDRVARLWSRGLRDILFQLSQERMNPGGNNA